MRAHFFFLCFPVLNQFSRICADDDEDPDDTVLLNRSITFPAREYKFYQFLSLPETDHALLQWRTARTARGERVLPQG